jgi:hypothetical protein
MLEHPQGKLIRIKLKLPDADKNATEENTESHH